jgi:hypothetical protein
MEICNKNNYWDDIPFYDALFLVQMKKYAVISVKKLKVTIYILVQWNLLSIIEEVKN